jgi:hypothetical protein
MPITTPIFVASDDLLVFPSVEAVTAGAEVVIVRM